MIPLTPNPDPVIHYYSSGNGWVGYTVWWKGRIVGSSELPSRKAAVKDAQATVRRIKAEAQQNKQPA